MTSLLVALLLSLGLAGCAQHTRYVLVPPLSAQALSLLGDTLWSVPISPDEGQRRVQLLLTARREQAEKPQNMNAALLLARRTAGLGRLREAIGLYTKAMDLDFMDPRPYRRRGELFLTIREFDLAVKDLQAAGQYALSDTSHEFNDLPDGSGLRSSTLRYGIQFNLGMAYYLRGDFVRASQVFTESLKSASTVDDVINTLLWQFFTSRRLDRIPEATQVLAVVDRNAHVATREPEHRLLLAYRGDVSLDSLLRAMGAEPGLLDDALYGYGIGFALLMRDRSEEAELAFEQVRLLPDWTVLPYIAAEAELARLQKKGKGK